MSSAHVVAGLVTIDSITNPDKMFENAGIKSVIARATHVDTEKKMLELSDGSSIEYDKIVLGTRASPVIPVLDGVDFDGVFTLRNASDAVRKKAKKIVFIGAGFINLELASLLSTVKADYYNVTIVELLGHPLPLMLDAEMGFKIQKYLVGKGFNMLMGHKVTKIIGSNGYVSGVELETGEKIDADIAMLSVGTKPNLELGRFGVKVNKFLETSDPDILAGGDCIEKNSFITKNPTVSQLRGPAVIQGRLAAKELAGYEIEFPGVLNNSATKLFDKSITGTGFTEELAQKEGFETVSVMVDSRSKHGMIPDVKAWTLKLIFDKETQRLIGGQIISDSESPVKEIDTINALILGEKTISDLTTLMCAGNPDLSSEPSREPIAIAAEQALYNLNSL
ncbi:MAG: FAD-dependent oxidoreductase [Desulfobacula sp.]|nr:FAD-dependent oxidoreductase [Desulfobacula sp.]